jgi:alkylation response protein AidB-like acyl-CoA dehydrogenase
MFLLIHLTNSGIAIRPIVSLTGEAIQNQVLFTNVRVPKVNVVGQIRAGWTVAKHVLDFERGGPPTRRGSRRSWTSCIHSQPMLLLAR